MPLELNEVLEDFEEAYTLYKQVGSSSGEANVRKAIGDVQQFRDEREAALASYEQALALFRQVGSSLDEANCFNSLGHLSMQEEQYEQALQHYNHACTLFQQIQDQYSQVATLYYRSVAYEAAGEQQKAIEDMESALKGAIVLDLPQAAMLQERLDELRG